MNSGTMPQGDESTALSTLTGDGTIREPHVTQGGTLTHKGK